MNDRVSVLLKVVLMFVVVLSGCTDTDDNDIAGPQQSDVLVPLNTTNYWIYERMIFADEVLQSQSLDTARIKTFTWNGETWHEYWRHCHCRNSDEGLVKLFRDDNHPDGVVELFFKYPASAGDEIQIEFDGSTVSLRATNMSRAVPSGLFQGCYFYRVDAPRENAVWDYLIKPGMGTIRLEGRFEDEGVQYTDVRELKEYHIE